ncbi:hypothetical protein [Vagococcus sp.]|uniref:hypothetical protein n=1 Tax=Vagococcus sp. TaxID=1933889 RepID=UPI003F9B50A3
MKKFISVLIIVLVIAGGGYFYYTEVMKTKAPDKIATNTGTTTVKKEVLKERTEEVKKVKEKFSYEETFESWDSLDGLLNDDGSYTVSKYPDKKLYLVMATQQEDEKIIAVFNDQPLNKK